MIRYILKRILWLIPVVLVVSLVIFGLMELAPGTFVDALLAGDITPEDREMVIEMYHLDKPMLYRYGLYMGNFIRGNLGVSEVTGVSVWSTFISRLPNTLILSFTSIAIATLIAVPLGIIAARRARTVVDSVVTVFSLVGMAMPVFWLGLLLILAFAFHLKWLPSGTFEDGIRSLILPAIAGSMILLASATRQTRSNMLEVLNSDYLRTARAKGVPENVVIRKHALGNAWIPIITTIGTNLGSQISGAVVVESVFAWPGIGRMAAEAVRARDVTTVTGTVIMTTILFVVILLIVDLIYAAIDPRIKAQYVSRGKSKARSPDTDADPAADTLTQPGGTDDGARWLENEIIDYEDTLLVSVGAASGHGDSAGSVSDTSAPGASEQSRPVKSFATRQRITSTGEILSQASAKEGAGGAAAGVRYKKRSQFGNIMYSLKKNKGAMVGFIIFAVICILFVASLFISYESITSMNARSRFVRPSWEHPFGTDNFGRDMLLRTIYGTRYTLAVGFGVVAFGVILGVPLGCVAGYYGRKVDDAIMRVTDIVQSLPSMLLGMVIVVVLGQSLQTLILAVGIQAAPIYLRMTRASILTVKNNEYVEASKAIGFSNFRTIFTSVLPNGWAPIIITLTASLGISINIGASLSYLGFGVPVPQPEWGALISTSSEFARSAPYLMVFPGLFIMLTVLAFNLLGDGIRDALDPKMRGR